MSEAKLFVGGLSWETNQDTLRSYFEKFGEVSDVTLKTDRESGKSRGFGFVTFADPASVSQVMANTSHMLDGRKIDPKVAQAKGGREPVLKVFVGGLDPEVPEDDIRAHFSQYGAVDKIELPFDKVKQQRRSFCFVQFQSEEAVNTLVNKRKDNVCGHEVDVKRATPPQQDNFGGGFGGRGGFGGAPRGGGGARGGRGGRGGAYGGGYGGAQGGGYGAGYGSGSYGGSYGSGGYGNGYGTSGYGGNGYGNGYDSSSYGSQKYSGYGAGDDSYSGYGASSGAGGWGGQTQSRSYHPYQR